MTKGIVIFFLTFIAFQVLFTNCGKSNLSGPEMGLEDLSSGSNTDPNSTLQSNVNYQLACVPKLQNKLSNYRGSNNINLLNSSADSFQDGVQLNDQLSITLNLSCIRESIIENESVLGYFSQNFRQSKFNNLRSIKYLNNVSKEFGKRSFTKQIQSEVKQTSLTYLHSMGESFSREEWINLIKEDHCLISVYPNVKQKILLNSGAPNDTYYSNQKHLLSIKHDLVYDKIFNPYNGINQSVKVAVIDTGIDVNHPDLKANFIFDSNGKILGFNAIDNNEYVQDSLYHGTHVAGIVGAVSNNTIGVSGVLGSNIKIIPIRVSTDGISVNSAAVVNGIRWAADLGVDVINLSLGGSIPSLDQKSAIEFAIDKGVFVVVAAGNNGKALVEKVTNTATQASIYPALWGASLEGMMTVGSVDASTGQRSSFSNYSSTNVEIMSPGSDGTTGILSTVPTSLSSTGYAKTVNGSPINGTSMASPVLAGTAAMVIALAKARGFVPSPDQIEKLIKFGSLANSTLNSYVEGGRTTQVEKLIATLDADININSSSTSDRYSGGGILKIQTDPMEQKVKVNDPLVLEVVPTVDSAILINYQWYKNNIAIVGANKRRYQVNQAQHSHGGQYFVEMKSGKNVIQSKVVSVFTATDYCN